MPFHCNSRRFSEGDNLHGHIEELWDDEIKDFYDIDQENSRFFYDPAGYLLLKTDPDSDFNNSFLKEIEKTLNNRSFPLPGMVLMTQAIKYQAVFTFFR